jgi:hypothetical protein
MTPEIDTRRLGLIFYRLLDRCCPDEQESLDLERMMVRTFASFRVLPNTVEQFEATHQRLVELLCTRPGCMNISRATFFVPAYESVGVAGD